MERRLEEGAVRVRRPWRAARISVAVVLGILLLAVAFDLGTASPRVCASCHEMSSRVGTWEKSAHVSVPCVKCHQTPRPWYALPQRVVDRGRLYARDVSAHLSGDFESPVETRTAGIPPMADDVCLQCHDPNRKATSGYRILIDHAEHAKRNGSCVSCHVRTAHPLESRGTALTLMAQCFTCHGTPEKPDASAECGVCHPSDYKLLPASHEAAKWEKGRHGDIATTDVALCKMCHEQSLCDDCHGLAMPHPADWTEAGTGHSVAAKISPATCKRCHTEKPDICTMCHHSEYDPARGTWVQQHSKEIEQTGVVHCIECHGPLYCVYCHIGKDR